MVVNDPDNQNSSDAAGWASIDGFVELGGGVLDDPADFAPLGGAAVAMIEQEYSVEAVMPRMVRSYKEAAAGVTAAEASTVTSSQA